MEGLNSYRTCLKDLRHRAKKLASTVRTLSNQFDQEANRLSREDDVSRLKAFRSCIRQRLNEVRWSEEAASYGHTKAGLIFSLGGLAVGGIVKMASKNKKLPAISSLLMRSYTDKQPPFGRVMVCIGPKGLPDDVRIVSISRLARESNRGESEVINGLEEDGCLLLTGEVFSLLIDRLAVKVREGRLLLPIPMEELCEIQRPIRLKPYTKEGQ